MASATFRALPSCLISLRRREDKRDVAFQVAAGLGIEPTWLAGTDGDSLKARSGYAKRCQGGPGGRALCSWFDAAHKTRRIRYVRNAKSNWGTHWGTLGCLMSHERALAQLQDAPALIVLEDDIRLAIDAKEACAMIAQALRCIQKDHKDWLILYLGCSTTPWSGPLRKVRGGPAGLCYARQAYQSHAFVISQAGAEIYCGYLRKGFPADNALLNMVRQCPKMCFALDPLVLTQEQKLTQSDIRESTVAYRSGAPRARKRGHASIARRRASLPQAQAAGSASRKEWLRKTRRASARRKSKRTQTKAGCRGSHTLCMSGWASCSAGAQAKVARPSVRAAIVERWGQATALCLACQTASSSLRHNPPPPIVPHLALSPEA